MSLETVLDRIERLGALTHAAPVIQDLRDEAIREAVAAGVTVSDVAELAGLTRQRVYQLIENGGEQ